MKPGSDFCELAVAVERHFLGPLTGVQARVATLRTLLSRLGEDDAWKLWNSSIWMRGHIVLLPIFPATWSRQRLLLAIAAAREAVTSRGGDKRSVLAHVFKIEPAFDAALDRALQLIPVDAYDEICVLVDQFSWSELDSLESLADLTRPSGPETDTLIDQIDLLGSQLSGLYRTNAWGEEHVA